MKRITLKALGPAALIVGGLFCTVPRLIAQMGETVEARDLMLQADYTSAAEKLSAPVAARDSDALMLQGILHAMGGGATYEYPLALDYWRTAALMGHRDAAKLLFPSLGNRYAREWWVARIASISAG